MPSIRCADDQAQAKFYGLLRGGTDPSGEVLRQFPTEQHDDVRQSLRRLGDNGYIRTTGLGRGDGEVQFLRIKGVTEKGLQAAGAWPDNAELLADRILDVLAERAEHEPEPAKRSRYQMGLRGLGGMTRDVLVEALATTLTKSAGLG